MMQRRLPHIYPDGRWLFVTWHLHGSLPSARFAPPAKCTAGEAFVWMDRYLDEARSGPTFLKREDIAQVVVDSLFKGAAIGHYQLGPFAIMSNHVHVLLLPEISASDLLKALKGSTARSANAILGRTGEPFWRRESYDHWVRDEEEWNRIARYIERNPVKAGLVAKAEEYAWSSAHPTWSAQLACVHKSVNAARTSACATKIPA
ncbi:MAG TPA: transposase [Bryobacteraceae bacterium]|nr:transposase [Bryobacteraceae bacterium]